jgi:signal transduction histidine kinase
LTHGFRKIFKKEKNVNQRWTVRKTAVVSALIIITVSFGLFFYFQHQTEKQIRDSIFELNQDNQIRTTKAIAENIKSDLNLIMAKLQSLSYSRYLQDGDTKSDNAYNALKYHYNQINNITTVDRLFLTDKNGIATLSVLSQGQQNHPGQDFSNREWIEKTKNTLSPVFSDTFIGSNGKYKIALFYPILANNATEGFIGSVGVVIPAVEFFKHFGNTYDIESSYISVLDSKAVQVVHPLPSLIGLPFFGNESQKITGHNQVLNNLLKTVIATGKPSSATYVFHNQERFNTGYPVQLDGGSFYYLFVITPTSVIYSKINDVISTERLEMFSLIAGITAAIMVLTIFLIRWNSILDKEVKTRTKELEESNKQISLANMRLETANEQLKVHDNMQKEFINIAAHELRTPIQPIMGLSEVVKNKTDDKEQKELLDIVIRNTKKLKNLAEDLLDVSKIESNALTLNKEKFNINQTILNVITDIQNNLQSKKKIRFEYNADNSTQLPVIINADKNRISQVIANIINNSVKFIKKEGTISVRTEMERIDGKDVVVVIIKDTGIGIDEEIFFRLFRKFATKSFQGTGLGLFICKNIVESHGGKIWAENNKDGKGSTFSFYLPVE